MPRIGKPSTGTGVSANVTHYGTSVGRWDPKMTETAGASTAQSTLNPQPRGPFPTARPFSRRYSPSTRFIRPLSEGSVIYA